MLNLIQNENMKIYRRIRTWILIALLIALCVTVSIIIRNGNAQTDQGDWRAELTNKIQAEESQLAQSPAFVQDQIKKQIEVDKYALAHDIDQSSPNVWRGVMNLTALIQLITIFTVIIAGDMVAGEFSWGTIKLLLIRPASRSKILLSKYISTFLFSLIMLATLFVSAFIINGILYGFSGISVPYLSLGSSGSVVESSMLLHVLGTYGLKCVELLMIVTLAFMISTVFRSGAMAIGLSLFIMFTGQTVAMLLSRYSWDKYFLFANTDLTQYIEGTPLVEGMTLGFSIAVLAGYFIIFNALSWLLFNKRDIAA